MKRLLSVILMLAMLLSIVPYAAPVSQSYEPTTEELEAVIKKVRTTIEIPKEQTEFSWDYISSSYRNRSGWMLTWSDKDYSSTTYITCDSDGNITSYSARTNTRDLTPSLPEKAADCKEYMDMVTSFISKIAPYTDGHLQLRNAGISSSLRNHRYSYNFIRVENGIIVPDNSVNVVIDYKTGEIVSANINYEQALDFSKPENLITEDKAKEILSSKQSMNLSYRLKYDYDEKTGELKGRNAYLVYTPELSYVSVDAVTGEIYTERNTWEIKTQAPAMNGAAGDLTYDKAESESSSVQEGSYRLSEEELAQLEVLNSLITKEEAIKLITGNKYLYLDSEATAVEANLQRYRNGSDSEDCFAWYIHFSKPYDEKSRYIPYASATIDAKTGALMSYLAGIPSFYDYEGDAEYQLPELIYDMEQATKITEEFLKTVAQEKFALTKQGQPAPEVLLTYEKAQNGEYDYNRPLYRAYDISYIRVNEGVDFPYNNLNTRVDRVTGKIARFTQNWYDDVVFESPKDAITPEQALKVYHDCEGFGLTYEINSTYTYNKYLTDQNNGDIISYDELYKTSLHTRPVYSAYNMGTNMIGALIGKPVNYNGDEYIADKQKAYTDIDNHWAKDIILRFSYADIGFDEDTFKPNTPITAGEFSNILNSCNIYGVYSDYDPNAQESNSITRAEAVKFIISYLGYEKVAKLENVYITDFADNMDLLPKDVGYIAIARGFGLINGDDAGFRPYDTLTRAEALQLCLNLLNTDMLS